MSNRILNQILFKCWPKFLFPESREKQKRSFRSVSVSQRKEDMGNTPGVEPWAFIRVYNEIRTIESSLNSIKEVIRQGVIGYNPSDDGTEEVIFRFCKENPGYIPFCYPYSIEPSGSKRYEQGKVASVNTLAAYYNAVLSKIPSQTWLIKIDCDQIFSPEILKHSLTLVKGNKNRVIYSRLNLIFHEDTFHVLSYIRPGDQWLIYNEGLSFEMDFGINKQTDEFHAYEMLKTTHKYEDFYPECSAIHFPYEKEYRPYTGDIKKLKTLSEFLKIASKEEFDENFFNEENIRNIYERFHS